MFGNGTSYFDTTSRIPPHCEPQNHFLAFITAVLGSCTPTPLAFVSTLLGSCSIISWLFAQLPQIIKNYQLQSTSGLSIFFLVEWCMGDMSNFFGAILTRQATWQIIIGAYYCFVDIALVAQWVWYERLKHGRPLRSIWLSRFRRQDDEYDDASSTASMDQVSFDRPGSRSSGERTFSHNGANEPTAATSIPTSKTASTLNVFKNPIYGSSPSSVPITGAIPSLSQSQSRSSQQRYVKNSFPSASPRTVLYITFLIAVCSRGVSAKPMAPSPIAFGFLTPAVNTMHHHSREPSLVPDTPFLDLLGTALSWTSTTLYLLSRMPQLLKNYRLRSTSGLSPLLFIAAFCGNLFYSTSMLFNPQAWNSFEPYGEQGWVGSDGSDRAEWVLNALPFFLGAAGVLVMDAAVGVQFWLYAQDVDPTKETVFVVRDDDGEAGAGSDVDASKPHWRRVSGWMRGWQPGVGGPVLVPAGPPHKSRKSRVQRSPEGRRLLDVPNGNGYGAI